MTLTIRPMYDSDIDEVYAIERAVHISPWNKEIIRDCVLIGYDCRVLESDDKKIIGYAISRHDNRSYHLLNFCIEKTRQSQGLGKKFLSTILDALIQNNNVDYVLLEVRPSNTSALALYTGMGFKQTEIKKEYYKDLNCKEDAIVLKKYVAK